MALFKTIEEKVSKQVVFTIMAVIMIFIVGFFVFSAISFLAANLNKAISADEKPPAELKFDIEGFEKLNLVQ